MVSCPTPPECFRDARVEELVQRVIHRRGEKPKRGRHDRRLSAGFSWIQVSWAGRVSALGRWWRLGTEEMPIRDDMPIGHPVDFAPRTGRGTLCMVA